MQNVAPRARERLLPPKEKRCRVSAPSPPSPETPGGGSAPPLGLMGLSSLPGAMVHLAQSGSRLLPGQIKDLGAGWRCPQRLCAQPVPHQTPANGYPRGFGQPRVTLLFPS